MARPFAEIAFTPAVRAAQAAHGSADAYARFLEPGPAVNDRLSDDEIAFIESRDSFYLGTVSETGWPYIQHRGGPAGFLKALDARTLGFADFRGNRQYVSVGNLAGSDKVSLFLIDYAARARLKIFGHARLSDDPAILAQVTVDGYRAAVERAMLITIAGFDWNCPQHITPRFTEAEIASAVQPLRDRIARLEAELRARDESAPRNR